MSHKKSVLISIIFLFLILTLFSLPVLIVDPLFFYHKPLNNISYNIEESRYMSYGLMKNFDYDSLILGSSMTANFKKSEFDELFNSNSIKIINYGSTFKENHNYLKYCLKNKKIKKVLWGLDFDCFSQNKEFMPDFDFPEYLSNEFLFDDYKYLLNRVYFNKSLDLLKKTSDNLPKGINSFSMDEYMFWDEGLYGKEQVFTTNSNNTIAYKVVNQNAISDDQLNNTLDTLNANVLDIVKKNPDIDFYFFITPYSILFFYNHYMEGNLQSLLQQKRIVYEQLIKYKNVHLFSFFSNQSIITDFDNYKDPCHYGWWINSMILNYIHNNEYNINNKTIESISNKEDDLILNYNYSKIFN